MQYMIYAGVVMAVLGLAGLGFCIRIAGGVKRDAEAGKDTKDRMQMLIALNTAALGTSFIGLALVTVGVLLS